MKSCTVAYFALILAIIFAVHVQAWTVVQHEQVEPSYQEGIVQIVIPRLSYTWNGFAAISSRAITNVEVNYGSLEVREDGLDQTKWNSCGLLPRSEDLGRLFSRKVWVLTPPSDARFREATTVTITYNSRAPEVWEQIKIFVFSTVMTEVFGSGSNQLWVGSEFNGGNVYPVYSQDVAGAVFDSNCNVKNNNALMHFSPFVLYDNARSATFSMPVLCRVVDQDFTFQGLSSLMSLEGYLGQNLFQFHLNEDLRVWPNQCQLDHEEGVAVTLTYDNGLTNGYIWKVLQGEEMEVKYDSGFCITNGYNEETRKTAKVSLRLWDSKTEVDKAEASSVSGPRTYRYMFEAGKSKRVEITEYNDVIRLYHIRTYSNAANPSECRIAGLGETVDYQTRDIVKCPQNTYKDTKSYHVDSCIPCPVNRPLTAGEGSTTIEDCKELACPKDQYVVDGQCVHCPANSVTMGEGSKTIDECVAPKGYYMNAENNVLPCPVDTYKEEVGNSECVPCTEGYVKSTYHKTACTSKDDCLIKSHAEGLAQKIATKRDIMKKIQLMTKFVKLYGFNPNL